MTNPNSQFNSFAHQRSLPPTHTSISVLHHPAIRSNKTRIISVLIKFQRMIHQQSASYGMSRKNKVCEKYLMPGGAEMPPQPPGIFQT